MPSKKSEKSVAGINEDLDRYLNTWIDIKDSDELSLKSELLDKIINCLIKRDDYVKAVEFIKEKLMLIDKKTNETEYIKTTILLITYLLQLNKWDELFSKLDEIKDAQFSTITRLNEEITKKAESYLSNLLKEKKFTAAIEFIKTSRIQSDLWLLSEGSKLTEKLIENSQDSKIMKFLLGLKEILSNFGEEKNAKIIHSWIRATNELKKVELSPDSIRKILMETKITYAPLILIKKFFESHFTEGNFKASPEMCNELSEFLFDVSELVYKLPNTSMKEDLLKTVNLYTNTIASGYAHLIFSRMKKQNLDRIMSLHLTAPLTVVDDLSSDFSRKNPSPYTRCLHTLIERWGYFPKLQTVKRDRYGRILIIMHPSFWFFSIMIMYSNLFRSYYESLPKSETLHHSNLVEIVKSSIDYFYRFRQCLRNHLFPVYKDLRQTVIQFLRQMTDMVKLSNEEIQEMVENSHWKSESEEILSKVIEEKNYCLYCGYNMPRGTTACPECGRPVMVSPFEVPEINSEIMNSFFSSKTKSSSSKKKND